MNSDRRMSCISAETGTKIFAVLNMILFSFGSLFFTAAFIYFTLTWISIVTAEAAAVSREQQMSNVEPCRGTTNALPFTAVVTGLAVNILLLKTVVFSAFLVNGVFKKNPKHIKVYFVFGVVKIILSGLASLSYIVISLDIVTTSILIIVHFIYSLVLIMIRKTYKNYEDSIQFDHKILDAEKY